MLRYTALITIKSLLLIALNIQLLQSVFCIKETITHFFITVSSSRSILFCTRTVGMSPTSASTFSLQLSIAWNDSLSVVEKTSTHAWAPGMQDKHTNRSCFQAVHSIKNESINFFLKIHNRYCKNIGSNSEQPHWRFIAHLLWLNATLPVNNKICDK